MILKVKKNISKITFMLILTNKKLCSKNRILPNLSLIKNLAMTTLYILKVEASIFFVPIPVD